MKRIILIMPMLLGALFLLAVEIVAQGEYWLAFQSNRDGSDDIFIMNDMGTGLRNLTANTAADRHPDWSPSGLQITFASDRSGNNDIYIMDNNGENVSNLTANSANDNSPDWSPDGTRIAFISDRDGGLDVYTVNLADGTVERLTTDGERKSAPTWSPDGDSISYWVGADGAEQIVTFQIATGARQALTSGGAASWPAWSPSGGQIAYFQNTPSGTADIFVVSAAGSAAVNLTNHPANDVRPAYSADASRIAFASDRDGNIEIYVMNADGTAVRPLTANTAEDTSPAWQPFPAAILPTEASAVVVSNGLRLTDTSTVANNAFVREGQGRLFAPTDPVAITDLIVIRLEIDPRQNVAGVNPPATETPLLEADVDVYEILGAELTGVDLERFRIEPMPTDYVLRLDLNDVNYWEWTLRARDVNTVGTNYLGVRVYAPIVLEDGTIAEQDIFSHRFTIEITQALSASPAMAALPAPTSVPSPDGVGDFALTLDADQSLTLITLGDVNLADLTLAGAGYPYGEFAPVLDVPALAAIDWQRGVCITYVLAGGTYRLSRLCDPSQSFEVVLSRLDVFWFDDGFNVPRDIVVRFDSSTFVCTSSRSACEFP